MNENALLNNFVEMDRVPLSPLQIAQLALAVIPSGSGTLRDDALCQAIACGEIDERYLTSQALASLWADAPSATVARSGAPRAMVDEIKHAHIQSAALCMLQKVVLSSAMHAFDSAGIAYAVFKGAHVREWLYTEPSVRGSGDVDILVLPTDRLRAVHALMNAGFKLSVNPDSVSHEVTLLRHGVEVDLHWHVSRPGRLRYDITSELIARTRRLGEFSTLSETDEVFLMLMHPAFTKYVSSPNMRLIRVVDFLYAVRDHTIDWDAVAELLERCGVKTAGWCVLCWYQMLHPLANRVPASFVARIAPGRLRAWYLLLWLRKDWPTRLYRWPFLTQMGLTLCFHDKLTDVWRALISIVRARRDGRTDELVALAQSHNASSK